ncbi:cellulose synthase/poly-beta-1,6-N-acetylglucosamine synthase-like glycosyltransferase [Arthrobacter sp. AG258]|uniref:glycosyltransferase family 2 protein n=1 Tax=Arthrobacter sp. AG258 TaxID=2183899 RepID=UPI00105B64D9|nr:glycosyltransferase family 2 protein [Arthrobacter sp. AG258]TDT85819.1 cellulose synthase/poly-beta-1,6-N-acetylglucosamine synthase-like glycosyltransferase [Arthrobacter sp. AG258]
MSVDFALVIFWLFASVSILYVVHFGLYLAGANFYDIWQQRRKGIRGIRLPVAYQPECAATATWTRRALPEMPGLVSIVIAAHNEEAVIVRTLDSIGRSTYRSVEVFVADDASGDLTGRLVRDYQLRHPGMDLRCVRMHKNVGKGAALNAVLRRCARGQFVMTLDADSVIQPDAISNALSYFEDPYVAGVAANVQIMEETTALGILQRFEHMIGYRSKKLFSLLNCEFVVGGVASTYRMRVLRKVGFYDTDTLTEDIGLSAKITHLGNRRFRMVYGADVVAKTEGVLTLRALAKQRYRWKYGSLQNLIKYRSMTLNPSRRYTSTLTCYRMPMAVLSEFTLLVSPLAWTYAVYWSLVTYTPALIVGAYATITAYTLFTIWMDENLTVRERARLSAYAPTAYFLFYIMDLVQLAAAVRCIVRSPGLVRRPEINTWKSPQRAGSVAVTTHAT